jgi:hypothetical protein
MLIQACFVVRPTLELHTVLKAAAVDETPFVPMLWRCDIADRTCWSRDDIVTGVKEAFLLHLKSGFLSPEETSILGVEGSFDERVFDRMWTVEPFWGADEVLEAVVPSLGGNPPSTPFLRARWDRVHASAKPGGGS